MSGEAATPEAVPAAAPTSTGLLSQPTFACKGGGSRKARQSATADRTALEWQCVTITQDHDVNPKVACKFCDWKGTAGASRIRDHIICSGGSGGVAKCKGSSPEYQAMKAKLASKAEGKKAEKAGALVVSEVLYMVLFLWCHLGYGIGTFGLGDAQRVSDRTERV